MTIESFIIAIVAAIAKKAAANAGHKGIVRTIEICSVFNAITGSFSEIESISDCRTWGIRGVRVLSGQLKQKAADALVGYGRETFAVTQSSSGISIASHIVPEIQTDPFSIYGGPVVGGARVPDVALNDMYYRANLEMSAKASSEGRHEDATNIRRTAELFRAGDLNTIYYEMWIQNARDWAKRGNYEKVMYCEEQARKYRK